MLPVARKDELVVQEAADELLVYDLKTNKAICLNPTSALVWENCDGTKTIEEITLILSKKFETEIKQDVIKFALFQLSSENLLDNENHFLNGFGNMSRRQIIKKVGVSAAFAIPIVSALTAPVAAQMGSCAAPPAQNPAGSGCPCSSPSQCTGGPCRSGAC